MTKAETDCEIIILNLSFNWLCDFIRSQIGIPTLCGGSNFSGMGKVRID